MFEDFAIRRGSLDLMSAWSAIEIASWDIVGKRAGLPLYNLLGGASRERVRVYANGWSGGTTIEERVERALKVKAMGFTAAKFDPFPGPWRSFVDREDEDFAIDYVRAMREALGPDFELLVEAHRRFAPMHAIRIGKRLAEFDIDWYEEPCLCRQYRAGRRGAARRADPDRDRRGDLLEGSIRRVPGRARRRHPEPRHLRRSAASRRCSTSRRWRSRTPSSMSPHNYNRTLIGLAATVHVVGGDSEFPDHRVSSSTCAPPATRSRCSRLR